MTTKSATAIATIQVTVHNAKKLVAKDIGGTSDPYVYFWVNDSVLNVKASGSKYHTKVKMKNLNPTWDQTFVVPIHYPLDQAVLHFEVYDFDLLSKHDFLGRAHIALKNINVTKHKQMFELPLDFIESGTLYVSLQDTLMSYQSFKEVERNVEVQRTEQIKTFGGKEKLEQIQAQADLLVRQYETFFKLVTGGELPKGLYEDSLLLVGQKNTSGAVVFNQSVLKHLFNHYCEPGTTVLRTELIPSVMEDIEIFIGNELPAEAKKLFLEYEKDFSLVAFTKLFESADFAVIKPVKKYTVHDFVHKAEVIQTKEDIEAMLQMMSYKPSGNLIRDVDDIEKKYKAHARDVTNRLTSTMLKYQFYVHDIDKSGYLCDLEFMSLIKKFLPKCTEPQYELLCEIMLKSIKKEMGPATVISIEDMATIFEPESLRKILSEFNAKKHTRVK